MTQQRQYVDSFFRLALVFIPIAVVLSLFHFAPLLIFITSAIAIIPLSKFLGDATENLSTHTGPAISGILNATCGNIPELIIALFALRAGLVDVVKASIVGSILSNLLLVLGMAIFFGGLKHKHQRFNATAAKASGTVLIMTLVLMIVPAVFSPLGSSFTPSTNQILISSIVSLALIGAYVASLIFSLKTHTHLYLSGESNDTHWPRHTSVIVLLVSAFFIAVVSELLVSSIPSIIMDLHWSSVFIGIIILSIIGNVAEHSSAIVSAIKNKMDLALSISLGSATQIAMLVTPIIVLTSPLLGHPITLTFDTVELVMIGLATLVVYTIVEDGESNWLEGLLLVIIYIVMASAFFLFT